MTPVTIPATPPHAREPDGLPFVPDDPAQVEQYRAAIRRQRNERNRMERAREMGVSPEQVAA